MIDENYLNQKLKWVKDRLEILDQIEDKLIEMRHLAEDAKDNKQSAKQIKVINTKLRKLQQEVNEIDRRGKSFCLDAQ